MRFTKSQSGFSLVEIMVSVAILAIIVTSILSATSGVDLTIFYDKVTSKNECKETAAQIISNIKSKGMARSFYHLPTPLGSEYIPIPVPSEAQEYGVSDAHRWPVGANAESAIFDWSTSPITIRPYRQIMGYMTALDAIYNANDPAICSTGISYNLANADLKLLMSDAQSTSRIDAAGNVNLNPHNTLDNANSTISIRPFKTDDGQYLTPNACPADVYTRPFTGGDTTTVGAPPRGLNNPALTQSSNYPNPSTTLEIGRQGNAQQNVGWEVTATVTHTNRTGFAERCVVSERFQYDVQNFPAGENLGVVAIGGDDSQTAGIQEALNTNLKSNLATMDFQTIARSPVYACNDPTPTGTVNFRIVKAKRDSMFMCRNLSVQRPLGIGGQSLVTILSATSSSLASSYPQRTTFFSNELLRQRLLEDRTNSAVLDDGNPNVGDRYFATLRYPAGTYACNTADGCPGLPRFAGFGGVSTGAAGDPSLDRYYPPSNHLANTNAGVWEPCERSAISCAVSSFNNTTATYTPSRATWVAGTVAPTSEDAYELQYTGLPTGCEVHIQVAEVDAAYNTRATEVREYIHERLPGNYLCHAAGTPGVGTPNDSWYFVCSNGGPPLGYCGDARTPRAKSTTRAVDVEVQHYSWSGSADVIIPDIGCCIDYPGNPLQNDNNPNGKAGVWIDYGAGGIVEAVDP